jgi:hypothetical protein
MIPLAVAATTGPEWRINADAARRAAEGFVGASASAAPRPVSYTDLDLPELGRDVPAWLVTIGKVTVPSPGETGSVGSGVTLDLFVCVHAADGRVLVVYSEPAPPPWPATPLPTTEQLLQRVSRYADLRPLASADTSSLSLLAVLDAAWRAGLNVSAAKQVIVRAVWSDNKQPAVKDGEAVVPLYPSGPGWLVSGLGMTTNYRAERGWYTQIHALIDDRSQQFIVVVPSP